MSAPNPWAVLGIEPTHDVLRVRRAYAAALKRTNPEQDSAAFTAIRQAYEQATAQARLAGAAAASPAGMRAPVATSAVLETTAPVTTPSVREIPAPGTVHVIERVVAAPGELDQLRANFMSLQRTVAESATPELNAMRPLLEACLRSPALDNLGVQLDFELAMVSFLWQTRPRTEPLLDIIIEHWKWRERGGSATASREIAALVAHADNARHLQQVRESTPRVHRALTRPPRPFWLWLQIVGGRLDSSVREVLEQLHRAAGGMPVALNAAALAWWQRFFTRPHIRPAFLQLTGVLTLFAIAGGVVTGQAEGQALVLACEMGLTVAAAGVAMAVGWWALVDWPRHRLKAIRRSAPRRLRFGWAPAGLLLCVVSPLTPSTLAATIVVTVLCFCLIWWAALMAPDTEDGLKRQRALHRVGYGLFVNAPLVFWWTLLAAQPSEAPTAPMWAAFVTSLVVFAIGQPLLWSEYLRGWKVEFRQWSRLGLGALALLAASCMLYFPVGAAWTRILPTGTVAIVLSHRTAAMNLTVEQLKARHYFIIVPALVLGQAFGHSGVAAVARYGTILFLAGVVLTMGACLYNEWKARKGATAAPIDLRTGRVRSN